MSGLPLGIDVLEPADPGLNDILIPLESTMNMNVNVIKGDLKSKKSQYIEAGLASGVVYLSACFSLFGAKTEESLPRFAL